MLEIIKLLIVKLKGGKECYRCFKRYTDLFNLRFLENTSMCGSCDSIVYDFMPETVDAQ